MHAISLCCAPLLIGIGTQDSGPGLVSLCEETCRISSKPRNGNQGAIFPQKSLKLPRASWTIGSNRRSYSTPRNGENEDLICTEDGEFATSVHNFSLLQKLAQDQWLDSQSLASLLQGQISLCKGRSIHAYIVRQGLEEDTFIANLLVSMYGRCGALDDAWSVFGEIHQPSVVSWNAVIFACAQCGHGEKALQVFGQMQAQCVLPNKVTFIGVLRACTSTAELRQGEAIHASIIGAGNESDVVLGSALVNLYGRCGAIVDARSVFDMMSERNLVSWNCMMTAYVQYGQYKEALHLFRQMQKEGVMPNSIALLIALSACASLLALADCYIIHSCAVYVGLDSDLAVGNSLVNTYGKCGAWPHAHVIFQKLHRRDVISWTALIAACDQQGQATKALKLFQQMQQEGVKPDAVTFVSALSACASLANIAEGEVIHGCIIDSGLESNLAVGNGLINMYGKCEVLEKACSVFDKMVYRDVVTWNAMIAAYAQQGEGKEALSLLQRMQHEGVTVNEVSLINCLSSCTSPSTLAEGEAIRVYIFANGYQSNTTVATALISMYGRCGALEDARSVFDQMNQHNLVSWNAMIAAYAQHGNGVKAFELFQKIQLEGLKPNGASFIGVLRAYSHAGLVDEGKRCFDSMNRDHDVTPTVEHYGCLIDLLGRAGQLDEAEHLISRMPVSPDAGVWETLLGACRMHHDVVRGIRAAEHVMNLDSQNVTPYLLLSNICATDGGGERLSRVLLDRCERATGV